MGDHRSGFRRCAPSAAPGNLRPGARAQVSRAGVAAPRMGGAIVSCRCEPVDLAPIIVFLYLSCQPSPQRFGHRLAIAGARRGTGCAGVLQDRRNCDQLGFLHPRSAPHPAPEGAVRACSLAPVPTLPTRPPPHAAHRPNGCDLRLTEISEMLVTHVIRQAII
jgi:hypothetical protein